MYASIERLSLLKEEMKYVEEKFSELKYKIDGT